MADEVSIKDLQNLLRGFAKDVGDSVRDSLGEYFNNDRTTGRYSTGLNTRGYTRSFRPSGNAFDDIEDARERRRFAQNDLRKSRSIFGQTSFFSEIYDTKKSLNVAAKELEKAQKRANEAVKDFSEKAKKELGDTFGEITFDNIDEALDALKNKFKDTENEIKKTKSEIENAQKDLDDTLKEFIGTKEELNKLGTSDDDLNQWLDEILNNKGRASGDTTEERINNLNKSLEKPLSPEQLAKLQKLVELKERLLSVNTTLKEKENLLDVENKKLQEQNDLLEKGADVTEKQAQAFNAQSNALDNSFNVVKKGLSNVEKGFKGLYAIGKDFVKAWETIDTASSKFARNIGMGREGMEALRKNTIQTVRGRNGTAMLYGIGMEEMVEIQRNYTAETGRNIQFTQEDQKNMAAMQTVMGDRGQKLASTLENFGLSYTDAASRAGKMFSDASKYGLSFEKYSENFLQNIKIAQNYTFKNGLKGLEDMAKKATAIKLDMQQVASFAEKVSTLQGAVETSAQLQVLGGPFAQFSDPLGMMNQGLLDMEGLIDRFQSMVGSLGEFNQKTGQVEVSAFNKLRLKTAAQAMGMDYNQVMESVQAQGRRGYIEKQLAQGGRKWTDAEREFILNTATVQEGKPMITYTNKEGKKVTRDVAQLQKAELAEARAAIQPESEDIKDIAKTTRSLEDIVKGIQENTKALKASFVESTGLGKAAKDIALTIGKFLAPILGIKYGAKAIGNLGSIVLGGAQATGGIGNIGTFLSKLGNGKKIDGAAKLITGKTIPQLGKAAGSIGASIAGIAVSITAGTTIINNANKKLKERDEEISRGDYAKGSITDRQRTIAAAEKKGVGLGMSIGGSLGSAIGTIIAGPAGAALGTVIGNAAGAVIGKILGNIFGEKQAKDRTAQSKFVSDTGLNLQGNYSRKDLTFIEGAIQRGGNGTISRNDFEELPERVKRKMTESGDISLFGDLKQAARGGLLSGPSHSHGGMPIVGSNIEVEGGEFVVNKNATRDNLGLLQSINRMDKGGIIIPRELDNSKYKVIPSDNLQSRQLNAETTRNIAPIDVNINGTIKLESNGKQVDMSALLKDPVFIRQITDLIQKQIVFNDKGARYTDKIA